MVDGDFVDAVLGAGLGEDVSEDERSFWHRTYRQNYTGDDGRHRLRVCSINLRDRDGLHARLGSVTCPVLWLQGTADQVYSVANAEEEITLFTGSSHAELRVIDGGQHFMQRLPPRRRQRSGRRVHRALELIDAVRVVVHTRRIVARYLPEPGASATVSATPASAGRMHQHGEQADPRIGE